MLLALLGVALALAACGCGSSKQPEAIHGPSLLRAGDLPGWTAVRADPGIGELAPNLSGLNVTARIESATLVHAGGAARATTLVFATPADATQAHSRGKEPRYVAFIEHEFGGAVVGRGPGIGYRLHVTRAAEPGYDTVELYLLRRGRSVALVELLSDSGLPAGDRSRLLDLVRSRLSR